jgi:hypothetical protein
MVIEQAALVEHTIACDGRGQYIALVYFGSPGGRLHHLVFKYSHKDPRNKDEIAILQDISHRVPQQYRTFIVAVSIVKRCLHPKTDTVAKVDRRPHYERLFSWVIEHDTSLAQPVHAAKRQHFEDLLEGHRVQSITLPYTSRELQELPVTNILTTTYGERAHAAIGLRGIERRVSIAAL